LVRYHCTDGICLRRVDYSNTSQVATFLTSDRGRLSVLAKGVKRAPKKGIRRGFDLLCRYELVYVIRRHSLHLLTDRYLRENFAGIRQSLERIRSAYYVAELVLNVTIEEDPCPALYGLLARTLRRLERGSSIELSLLLLEIGALQHCGVWPRLDACARCGGELDSARGLPFSPGDGGALCGRCSRSPDVSESSARTEVDRAELATLAELAAQPPARVERVRMPPARVARMSRILRFYIRHMLGKELKTWKYLPRRVISRRP